MRRLSSSSSQANRGYKGPIREHHQPCQHAGEPAKKGRKPSSRGTTQSRTRTVVAFGLSAETYLAKKHIRTYTGGERYVTHPMPPQNTQEHKAEANGIQVTNHTSM